MAQLVSATDRNPEENNFCAMGILTPGPLQHAKMAISSVTTDRQTPDRLVECQSQWNKPQKAIAQTLEPKKFNSSTKGKVFWCVWSERDVAVIVTRSTRRRNRRTRCFRSSSTCGGWHTWRTLGSLCRGRPMPTNSPLGLASRAARKRNSLTWYALIADQAIVYLWM